MRRLLLGLLLAAAGVSISRTAAADPHPAHPVVASAPSGRVGRLAAASGEVDLEAGSAGWSAAEINDPVAAGSAMRTGPRSRAEIEIGVDAVDLDANSNIVIAALAAHSLVIELVRGRVGLALRRGTGMAEVELPQGEVWAQEKGAYEIDAGEIEADITGAPARVTAFAGSARVFVAGVGFEVAPNEAATLVAAAPLSLTITPAATDDFTTWWRSRTGAIPDLAAPVFVSPDLTGFAALADSGHWRRTGAYGEVWLPAALPADWAPYRDGHWRWFPPWGWTWIDDEPWGFAPFHYGRWTRVEGHWAWVPGDLATNPVYVPAAVAFLGTPAIGVSYAGGSGPAIGWFPLAPGEAYWPSYSRDLDYIRGINRGDLSDLAAIRPQPDGRLPVEVVDQPFANRLAASVVPRQVFTGGRPVMPGLIDLPQERLRNVPVVMGSPRFGPPAPPPVMVAIARPLVMGAIARRPAVTSHVRVPAARRAHWIATVRLAAIRSQHYQETARLRHFVVLRLAAPAPPEPLRLRRLVALRVVHPRPERKDEHPKKISR